MISVFSTHLPQLHRADLTWTIILLIFMLVLYKIYFKHFTMRRRDSIDMTRNLSGPVALPIFGNVFQMSEDLHLTLHNWSKIYGPVFRIKLGKQRVAVISTLTAVKEALLKNRDCFAGRPLFSSNKLISFGEGIVFNDRTSMPDWYTRKEFLLRRLHRFVAGPDTKCMFEKRATLEILNMGRTLENVGHQSSSTYVEPSDVIKATVGNFMCSICYGRRYDTNDADFKKLLSVNKEFGDVVGLGNRIDTMPWIKIFPKFRNAAKTFSALCDRMSNWNADRVNERMVTHDPATPICLLDFLLLNENISNGNEMNGKHKHSSLGKLEITALMNDIFGAGQDTLVNAQHSIFYYLIKFPSVAKNIQRELEKNIDGNRTPTLSDRKSLPYIEAVIHEVFRHSSFSAVILPHRTLDECVVQGVKIPEKTTIFFNFYTINSDPVLWHLPEVFNPERFLKHSKDGDFEIDIPKTKQYIAFSMGARKCPGDETSYAWLNLSTAILMSKYDIFEDPHFPVTEFESHGLTMGPKQFQMKFVRRDKQCNGTR